MCFIVCNGMAAHKISVLCRRSCVVFLVFLAYTVFSRIPHKCIKSGDWGGYFVLPVCPIPFPGK
jgi:hypothetical protein